MSPQSPKTISLAGIESALLTESQLDVLAIPLRRRLLDEWFYEGDLGFVFAPRGVGKTWMGLAMARALADGAELGPWKAGEAVKVLYVDGEMHLGVMRERNQFLRNSAGENLLFLSHQQVFDVAKSNLGLSNRDTQTAITALCVKLGVKVLFLDNLSTLFTGVKENEADGWRDMVEGWLLELRRNHVAVVIIAHAGRNGSMRGTSKREDCAFWQICLDRLDNGGDGASFVSRFTKNRNALQDPPPNKWRFQTIGQRTTVTWEKADPLQLLRAWISDGLTSCSEIAEEMGLTKGAVSKLATKAEREGWLKKEGRDYKIVEGR
jgi:putative DNA primase/helicase